LFSCALGLYAAHAKTVDLDLNVLNGLSGPLAKLQYIFSQTSAAVPKEELIKLIWNENSSEASLNRLRQLVYSYKKKYRTEIVSHQNTYKMDKAS
jgi:DNA-binding SARP family transcriptional activator